MNTQVTKTLRMHPVTLLSHLMPREFQPIRARLAPPSPPRPPKPARRLSGFFDLL
jgi:hypothetical protein